MRRAPLGSLMVLGMLAAPGCLGRAVKETAGLALGAKGLYTVTQDSQPLTAYGTYEVGVFKDEFSAKTPPELFSLLPGEIEKRVAQSRKITGAGGAKAAVIRGEVVYYESGALLGQAFGPMEEVVARVELVDKATGQVIAKAVCVGRSEASTTAGVRTKAEGLAKGIIDWIESRYPKGERDEN